MCRMRIPFFCTLFPSPTQQKKIMLYLIIINIAAFAIYAWDKHLSKKRNARRIPERNLLLIAALGGSIGALLAMYLIRHKTLHKKFSIGVPAILIIQLLIVLFWAKNYFIE